MIGNARLSAFNRNAVREADEADGMKKPSVCSFFPFFVLFSTLCCQSPSAGQKPNDSVGAGEVGAVFPARQAEGGAAQTKGDNPWITGFAGASAQLDPLASAPKDASAGHQAPDDGDTSSPRPAPTETEAETEEAEFQTEFESGGPKDSDDEQTELRAQLLLTTYLEGQGTDKLLSLTNTGHHPSEDCGIEVYSNGSTSPWRTLTIDTPLAPGQTWTLCSESIGENAEDSGLKYGVVPVCDQLMTGSPYNGNDALLIVCGGREMDSFGQLGFDPGEAWSDGDELSSKDAHLTRCNAEPDKDPSDSFVLQDNWVAVNEAELPEQARLRCPGSTHQGGATSR